MSQYNNSTACPEMMSVREKNARLRQARKNFRNENVRLQNLMSGTRFGLAIVPWHRRPLRRKQAPPGPFEIFYNNGNNFS